MVCKILDELKVTKTVKLKKQKQLEGKSCAKKAKTN